MNIVSFEFMTDVANPDRVSGFSHSIHPWSHRFATAVGIEHLIPLDSRMLSKNCWTFEKYDKAKKVIALSYNCVGITFPLEEASSIIFWVFSNNVLKECDDFS